MLRRVVDLILAALAAHRATLMVLAEGGPGDIFQILRDFVDEKYEPEHWVYRGMECPYCISFWLALVFLLAPPFIREWFAVAEVAGRLYDYDRSKN